VIAPESVWVIADKGIRYAIEHAVRNAVEHNDRETPSVTVSVESGDRDGHGRGPRRRRAADPGHGGRSAQARRGNQQHVSRYGVGLWVILWCVESLGGELVFEENTPRGNVVSISLPKAAEPSGDE